MTKKKLTLFRYLGDSTVGSNKRAFLRGVLANAVEQFKAAGGKITKGKPGPGAVEPLPNPNLPPHEVDAAYERWAAQQPDVRKALDAWWTELKEQHSDKPAGGLPERTAYERFREYTVSYVGNVRHVFEGRWFWHYQKPYPDAIPELPVRVDPGAAKVSADRIENRLLLRAELGKMGDGQRLASEVLVDVSKLEATRRVAQAIDDLWGKRRVGRTTLNRLTKAARVSPDAAATSLGFFQKQGLLRLDIDVRAGEPKGDWPITITSNAP